MIFSTSKLINKIITFRKNPLILFFYVVIVIILVLGVNVRLKIVVPPIDTEDLNSNVLIASHIVEYGEFPLYGQSIAHSLILRHSGFHYYFFALLYSIYPGPLFPAFVNLVIQTISVICIALAVLLLANPISAILALIFFLLNSSVIYKSAVMSEAEFAGALTSIALALVLYYKETGKRGYKIFSTALLSIVGLYYTPIVPVVLILLVSMLFDKNGKRVKGTIWYIFLSVIVIIFGYSTNIKVFINNIGNTSSLYWYSMPNSFIETFHQGANILFSHTLPISFNSSGGTVLLFSLGIFLLWFMLKKYKHSRTMMALFVCLVVSLSLFSTKDNTNELNRHIAHLVGILQLLCVFVVFNIYKQVRVLRPVLIFIGLIFLYKLFSVYLLLNQGHINVKSEFIPYKAIRNDVGNRGIKEFMVKTYTSSGDYPYNNAVFLYPLEHELNIKLAKVDNSYPINYSQITNKDGMYILCRGENLERVIQCDKDINLSQFDANVIFQNDNYTMYYINGDMVKAFITR